MGDVTARNFGLLVAYLIPGFVALWGVSFLSDPVRAWLWGGAADGATVGGFLYVTLASVAVGMTASAVRWAVIDWLHHATGVKSPKWDDAVLEKKLSAFEYVVEQHYRYYQFYGNSLVALLFTYGAWQASQECPCIRLGGLDVGVFLIGLVFFAGSRDALRKYYRRASVLLGDTESEKNDDERQLRSGDGGKHSNESDGKGEEIQEDGEPG